MFSDLIQQWSNEEGFRSFVKDNSKALRNLANWLDRHVVLDDGNTSKSDAGSISIYTGM